MVAAVALAASLAPGPAQAASAACFAVDEAKAAQLRRMQQEFTVAAIACAPAPGETSGMAETYNRFVGKFGGLLRDNARTLVAHFARAGSPRDFDTWMTRLANTTSARVGADPVYCDQVRADLDRALAVAPADLADFAANERGQSALVPLCDERQQAGKPEIVGMAEIGR